MDDFLIIGGGITGTFIARELTKYDVSVRLLEKEADLAQIQTTHNSALIHSPVAIPPSKGPLKSRLALKGNRIHQTLAPAFKVPTLQNGAYMCAFDKEQAETLKALKKEADDRGLDASFLSPKEAIAQEPSLDPDVCAVLLLPDAMTADTYDLVRKLARNAQNNGAVIQTGMRVDAVDCFEDHFVVHTAKKTFKARHLINAAGIMNARVAGMVEKEVPYVMRPHRGEYYVLEGEHRKLVHHTLFPVPGEETKGILVIPQPDGSIRLGPTSEYQTELESAEVTHRGLEKVRRGVNRLLKNVPFEDAKRTYAGLRSTIDKNDFYIARSKEHERFIHVAGIDSPGVTAAPAIAQYVVDELIRPHTLLSKKKAFDPFRI